MIKRRKKAMTKWTDIVVATVKRSRAEERENETMAREEYRERFIPQVEYCSTHGHLELGLISGQSAQQRAGLESD